MVGFLAGVIIWMPFLLDVRMEIAIERLRAETMRELAQRQQQRVT
jgi:hypothetical protein